MCIESKSCGSHQLLEQYASWDFMAWFGLLGMGNLCGMITLLFLDIGSRARCECEEI